VTYNLIESKPSTKEVGDWILETVRHSYMVEYFLNQLNIGQSDLQRPHDLEGLGNKLSWPVIKGLAIQNRKKDPVFFRTMVLPSIRYHQIQYHHVQWNEPKFNPDAEEMKVGAVDSICSMLENREYQGGYHSFKDIREIIVRSDPKKQGWLWNAYSRMREIPIPHTHRIKTLDEIHNIGIPQNIHDRVVIRVQETLEMLASRYGYEDIRS